MFRFLRKLLHRPAADSHRPAAIDPDVSRAGQATAGMRPGDQRHRPSADERHLAERIGTSAYDPERRQI